MSGNDFAAIQVGDKVKVRFRGLESVDWDTVAAVSPRNAGDFLEMESGISFYTDVAGWEVIAHQPAPRKVEVTLGEPLTRTERAYREPSWSPLSVARLVTLDDALYVATEGSTVLTSATARRLALDILATVGVEE